LWDFSTRESLAGMGLISNAIDKLPKWAKVVLFVAIIVSSISCIVKYGFFTFLIRMIFSPEI
jgi:hypothetical protein